MRLALAQLNPLVGDLSGNTRSILKACEHAEAGKADLLLTPELSLWGYPPRDLLLQPGRLHQQQSVLDQICRELDSLHSDLTVLVGAAIAIEDDRQPGLHNTIVQVTRSGWQPVAHKQLLPNYDVFDERRYFRPGDGSSSLVLSNGLRLGLTICEDLWVDTELQRERLSGPDPVAALIDDVPDLLINLAASPFDASKPSLRRQLAARAALRLNCPIVYLNQVGGNDELIFDGGSFLLDHKGDCLLQMPYCQEWFEIWDSKPSHQPALSMPPPDPRDLLFRSLVLGVRDYGSKCGFQKALLGLSGGIDSALVAVIATAALGPDAITTLLMPSPWSSNGSIEDATSLADRLGISSQTVPIASLMQSFGSSLAPALDGEPQGVTAENLQSRIRGTLLMAVANQQGQLLLTTGNKSELAVGYCTLYGDMNGGLAVIGDLYKTTVFALCDWLDSDDSSCCRADFGLPHQGELVGEAIRTKPPSAELRPDQKDSDSLPDYGELDALLRLLIEERRTGEALVAAGFAPELVERVETMLRRAEFKRRQSPPLLKVSPQAFGTGWRLPIAAA